MRAEILAAGRWLDRKVTEPVIDPTTSVFLNGEQARRMSSTVTALVAREISAGRMSIEVNPNSLVDNFILQLNRVAQRGFGEVRVKHEVTSFLFQAHWDTMGQHETRDEIRAEWSTLFELAKLHWKSVGKPPPYRFLTEKYSRMKLRLKYRLQEIDWEEVLDELD